MDVRITDFLASLTLAFVSLFPIVNPVGDAPLFLSLTRQYAPGTRRFLARKIAAYGFGLLAGSLILGSSVLAFFGVTLPVIEIAGGLVLAATGWQLLGQDEQNTPTKPATDSLRDALQHAFYPLTLPLTVGPGCISISVALGAHLLAESGPGIAHGVPIRFSGALAGMLLLCVLVAICYENADQLVRRLGPSGTTIVIRLSAFILLAIGVQIAWNGLRTELLSVLGRPGP